MADEIQAFYERHPYPPPVDDLERYRRLWQDDRRRRADHHLVWPARRFERAPAVLVAGCGTMRGTAGLGSSSWSFAARASDQPTRASESVRFAMRRSHSRIRTIGELEKT